MPHDWPIETQKLYQFVGEIAIDLANNGEQISWSELQEKIIEEFGSELEYGNNMALSSMVYNGAVCYWKDEPDVVDALNSVFCSG